MNQLRNAGLFWTNDQESELVRLAENHMSISGIALVLERSERAIILRARKMLDEMRMSPATFRWLESEYDVTDEFTEADAHCVTLTITNSHEDNHMQKTWTMVSLLQENIMTVKVRFDSSSKLYTYKTRMTDLEVDDWVVVAPRGQMKVVQIVKIDDAPDFDIDSGLRYDWIVQKVNTDEYENLVADDERAYELLVESERHVARKKLVDAYSDNIGLSKKEELIKLLSGKAE